MQEGEIFPEWVCSFFFFLVSNYFINKKNDYVHRKCTQQHHIEIKDSTAHLSNISAKELQETKLEAFNQSYNVCKKDDFKAGIESSSPTNTLLFHFRHMHHMRQCGIAFHIAPASDFPNLLDQHVNKSTTPLGIT